MSLQTGATLVALSLLFNKISGFYGILALLTGFELSPVQLSMYIYSLLALLLSLFLVPHIRKQTPLHCLALAWLYLIDSVINAAYTAAFAVSWFLVISQHERGAPPSGPGSMMGDTAGFTNDHIAVERRAKEKDGSPSLGHGVLQPESIESIGFVCALWVIRVYFVLIMMAFARQCIRQHAFDNLTSLPRHGTQSTGHSRNVSGVDVDLNPFSVRKPDGQGWQGNLGRFMISIGRSYWLDAEDDAGWMTGMSRRFRRNQSASKMHSADTGPSERERRRRSGTGPPVPSQSVVQGAALQQYGQAAGGAGAGVGQSSAKNMI
ncbi:hypothetical protein FQN54_009918 [Arachnomyces sp. PD_36]|nr:hypothetical protein FQN54_009918 [Arachnomyces sp. PD_36]